jgi:DDE superfamily endonuclease
VLPLSPGRAERHGFEYYRHGTLSLYATLDVKTGKVEGETAKRHTSAEFIAFLNQLLSKARWANEIHIVLDNLSAHKTKAVEEFLQQHPKVRFSLHSHLLLLVKPGGVVVRQDPARRDQPRGLHFGC